MFAKTLRIVAVNLALLLVCAVVAELLFGTWFSTDPLDKLGLPRDTSVTVDASTLYAGGGAFTYNRDRWGLRGSGTDPAKITILTVGGSTTNQLYLPEPATWQKELERAFAESGRNIVVANGGIDGQSTVGHLKALAEWFTHIPGLKPRFVVAYVGLNDIHITGSWVDDLQHPDPIRQMQQKSAIVRLWNQVAGMVKARRAKLNHQRVDYDLVEWTDKPNQPKWRSDRDSSSLNYKRRLVAMAERIHAMGAVPIFVTQPRGDFRVVNGRVQGIATVEGLNGVDQYRLLAEFNQATREICRDEGLMCLDLARELTFDKGDFYDYLHTTPKGAAKIGRWLHGKLAGLV
jgi:lysophospholipase L1-like esterase